MQFRWIFILLLFVSTALTVVNVRFEVPEHFPAPEYNFRKNPLSEAKINLGRELFYDPILSADNSVACASCHSPSGSFAHTDQALSKGVNGLKGTRNAPALFNLAWQTSFMWDGAADHLHTQALLPMTNKLEMGADIKEVILRLQTSSKYTALFKLAYGDEKITEDRIVKAIEQFELTLVSAGSKYDDVMLGKAEFTKMEEEGYAIFQENCANCHTEPLFTNDVFADIALPEDPILKDHGRMAVTGDPADSMFFKVPSLRNLSYSFPYMHDGRFKTIMEVLNYYEDNRDRATDNRMKYARSLSQSERSALEKFLLTLNDPGFVSNPKYTISGR